MHPYMARFRRNWASVELLKQYLTNKRRAAKTKGLLPEKIDATEGAPHCGRKRKSTEDLLSTTASKATTSKRAKVGTSGSSSKGKDKAIAIPDSDNDDEQDSEGTDIENSKGGKDKQNIDNDNSASTAVP